MNLLEYCGSSEVTGCDVGFKLFKVSAGSSVFDNKDEHMNLTLWGSDTMTAADSYVTECNLSGW